MLQMQFKIGRIHKHSILLPSAEDDQEIMNILGVGVLTLIMSF